MAFETSGYKFSWQGEFVNKCTEADFTASRVIQYSKSKSCKSGLVLYVLHRLQSTIIILILNLLILIIM